MIMTTTPTIEGHRIKEYRGIVTGEAILGAHLFKDLFASIRDMLMVSISGTAVVTEP